MTDRIKKLVQGASSRQEFRNMRNTNHQYTTKILPIPAKKVGRITRSSSTFSMDAYQTNVLIMENVHLLVDENSHPSWAELLDEFANLQEHELRRDRKFIQYYSEVGKRTFWRDSECETPGMFISILGKIGIVSCSSDQMGKGKSVCLRWFRSMSGTDEWHLRKHDGKVKWKDSRCIFLTKNQWELMEKQFEIRLKYFRRIFFLGHSSRDPRILDRRTSKPKSSRTGSSSCECSMTLIGQKEWMVRRVSRMQKIKDYAKKFLDVSRSWIGREVVWKILLPSKKRMGLHSQQNGTAFHWNRSLCV